MGSLCTNQPIVLPDSSKVVQGTQIPEWVSAAGKQIFEQASELAQSEPAPFPAARIAEYGTDDQGNPIRLTEDERAGMDILRGSRDRTQQFVDKAANITDTLGQGYDAATREELLGPSFDAEMAGRFQDVFQTAVDPALEQLERDRQNRQIGNRADAVRAGAFGGSRLGVREALTDAEISRAGADIRRQAGREALEFGANRFDADRAARFAAEDALRVGYETDEASRIRAAQAQADLAPLTQALDEQQALGLITAGEARRRLDQAALDLGYADFVEQRERPFQMLNFALGALQGVPYDQRTISLEEGQQFLQQPSIYGQTIGALGTAGSLYAMGRRV